MLPGKKEIRKWFEEYLKRAGTLVRLEELTPDKMYWLMGAALGWYWDVEDVGKAPHPVTGDEEAFSGLYKYFEELLAAARTEVH